MAGGEIGFIILGSANTPIASTREALRVLSFPQDPDHIADMPKFLRHKLDLLLPTDRKASSGWVAEFRSGRRRYVYTVFPLERQRSDGASTPISTAVLFERSTRSPIDLLQTVDQYNLTPRERELVQNLLLGLTTKEIAVRMKVSASTVNTFLHMIMVKMGAKTRSGIVRKIVCRER